MSTISAPAPTVRGPHRKKISNAARSTTKIRRPRPSSLSPSATHGLPRLHNRVRESIAPLQIPPRHGTNTKPAKHPNAPESDLVLVASPRIYPSSESSRSFDNHHHHHHHSSRSLSARGHQTAPRPPRGPPRPRRQRVQFRFPFYPRHDECASLYDSPRLVSGARLPRKGEPWG